MSFEGIEKLIYKEQKDSEGTFVDVFPLDGYISKLKANAEFLTYYDSGQCEGLVAFYCNDLVGKKSFITLVLLSRKYRGKGIASELINGVIRICVRRGFHTCSLEVDTNNVSAKKLYEKIGFEEKGISNNKFSMILNLKEWAL